MQINEMNYELFALDFVEGKLSGTSLVAMEEFLQQNPLLKEEIYAICDVTLPITKVVYENKNKLIKERKLKGISPLILAISTAACLILAVGFIWFLSNQQNFGTMAYDGNTININLRSKTDILNNNEIMFSNQEATLKDKNTEKRNVSSKTAVGLAEQMIEGVDENMNEVITAKKSELIAKVQENIELDRTNKSGSDKLEIKNIDLNQEVVELQYNTELIIATTISIYPIEQNTNSLINDRSAQIAMNEEVQSRKKVLRESVKSIFQNALLPKGISNSISN